MSTSLSNLKKFFSYVVAEYCEETCTVQGELMRDIEVMTSEDEIADMFIEEGFMSWKKEDFDCDMREGENEFSSLYASDDWDLSCVEKYWQSVCKVIQVDFDEILELL
jgi:hypothetical protein